MADSPIRVSNTIDAADEATDRLQLRGDILKFSVTLVGDPPGTARVQYAPGTSGAFANLIDPSTGVAYAITAAGYFLGKLDEPGDVIVKVPAADFTSGSTVATLRSIHKRHPK